MCVLGNLVHKCRSYILYSYTDIVGAVDGILLLLVIVFFLRQQVPSFSDHIAASRFKLIYPWLCLHRHFHPFILMSLEITMWQPELTRNSRRFFNTIQSLNQRWFFPESSFFHRQMGCVHPFGPSGCHQSQLWAWKWFLPSGLTTDLYPMGTKFSKRSCPPQL